MKPTGLYSQGDESPDPYIGKQGCLCVSGSQGSRSQDLLQSQNERETELIRVRNRVEDKTIHFLKAGSFFGHVIV